MDEDVDGDWLSYWRSIFKVITVEDIENYEKKYKGQNAHNLYQKFMKTTAKYFSSDYKNINDLLDLSILKFRQKKKSSV